VEPEVIFESAFPEKALVIDGETNDLYRQGESKERRRDLSRQAA
jgi:hypothetical protein